MYEKIYKKIITTLVIASFVLVFVGLNSAHAVTPPGLGLGLADSYSVFGKAGVTTTGVTHVWGDAGADSSVGLIQSQVGGSINVAPASGGVETDARSTYMSLMDGSQGTPAGLDLSGTHIGVNAITPGVYNIGAGLMNGAVELSGDGVYIFRSDSSPTISATGAAHMTLTNGACASKVFWAIPTSMTIGTYAHIEGTIIASTGLISLATGATLVGRAISLISQVTLDANQITEPTCAPHLTLVKEVDNTGVGTATADEWTLTATGTLGGSDLSGKTGTTGANSDLKFPDATFKADIYTLAEIPATTTNYATTYSCVKVNNGVTTTTTSSSINLVAGDNATCTIKNTYADPTPASCTLFADPTTVVSGNSSTLTWTTANAATLDIDNSIGSVALSGTRSVSPTMTTDYIGTVNGGATCTATVTVSPIPSTLVLNKIVDNTGSAIIKTSDDFQAKIDGVDVPWVTPQTLTTGVQYTASEVSLSNYTASDWGGGCAADGTITLVPGVNTCTITNTYYVAPVQHSSSGSSVVPVFEPTITILSTPVVVAPMLPKTGFAPQESSTWYESLLNNILNLLDKNIK